MARAASPSINPRMRRRRRSEAWPATAVPMPALCIGRVVRVSAACPHRRPLVDSAVRWPPRVVLARICFVTRSRAWMATSFIVPLMMLLGACGTGVFTLHHSEPE